MKDLTLLQCSPLGVSRNCTVSPASSGANQLHMVLSRATMQSVRAEQQTRAQRAVTQRPQPTASDGFLARLGQAESRDTARAQQSRMIQHQQQRFIPPTHAQLLHDLDDGLRTPRRTLADKKLLVQERSPPSPPKPPSQPSWADANVLRNVSLLGSKATRVPTTWQSPQETRIRRMLASTGGAAHNPFYASETSKFNSAQPQARRGQESSIVFGTPSVEENRRYLEYMMSL
jgi:hypothetical protein